MKVNFIEYSDDFGIIFEAETVEDASKLVRYGINKTKEIKYSEVFADRDEKVSMQIVIRKKKQSRCIIR